MMEFRPFKPENINLIGEVKVPGTYNLTALSTVINALYSAGGPTQNGSFRNIEVYRNNSQDFCVIYCLHTLCLL